MDRSSSPTLGDARARRASGPGRGARLADVIASDLANRIHRDGLVAGDRMPSEAQLCADHGVSRPVVREAVARLVAQGLLETRRGSGIFVLDGPPDTKAGVRIDHLDRVADVLDVLELRIGVEVEAAALAAERRTAGMLASIGETMLRFNGAVAAEESASDLDAMFHRLIAEATGNGRFAAMIDTFRGIMIPRRALGARFAEVGQQTDYLNRITSEHEAIYEAIGARDAEAARAAMRHHLESARDRYRQWRLDPARLVAASKSCHTTTGAL